MTKRFYLMVLGLLLTSILAGQEIQAYSIAYNCKESKGEIIDVKDISNMNYLPFSFKKVSGNVYTLHSVVGKDKFNFLYDGEKTYSNHTSDWVLYSDRWLQKIKVGELKNCTIIYYKKPKRLNRS